MRSIATRWHLMFLVVATTTLLRAPMAAQIEPERPRVALTQMSFSDELWPADFNEDGVTDIVSSRSTTGISIRIGLGDGTFTPPTTIHGSGTPVGVGDLNKDGFIDVLAREPAANNTSVSLLLAGNGDGTFIGPLVLSAQLGRPTYVVDLNNDGHMDLLAAEYPPPVSTLTAVGPNILLDPGNGDFTFGAPVSLRPGSTLTGVALADFDGNGLIDIAAHSTFGGPPTAGRHIDIFENQGNFVFAATSIPTDAGGAGIAARDLNGDGLVDLVAGFGTFEGAYWSTGFIHVMLGVGAGTFAPPIRYPVNVGPVQVVIGDFNGDRVPDIATGNQSTIRRCDVPLREQFWDSVSILPGRGDGTFGATASFALGNSETSPDTNYRRGLIRLNASDLNADGRTDLLVSAGAILLMLPPGPNTPPVANAGPDQFGGENDLTDTLLRGSAFDADADWLTFTWKDDLGRVYPGVPTTCLSAGRSLTTRTFTMTVTDELGGTSSDSMQWTFSGSAAPPGLIPQTFTAGNIGDATNGFDGFGTNGVFRIAGSGTDVWETSDSFRFVQSVLTGDFDVITRVTSLENVDPWAKAGLMVRETLTTGSRHAFVFVTPTSVNGVAFQRREVEGGPSIHTSGPAVAPPVWLRLVRQADLITAFTRINESDPWSVIGTQTLAGLPAQVHVGMAVTSHRTGGLATALFGNYTINGEPPPSSPPLPAGWTTTNVGSVAAAGSATYAGDAFTVDGSGADIWDNVDAFRYVYKSMPGDGIAFVRMAALTGPHEWTKGGLMIRQSLSPSAPHHFLLRSVSHGAAWQRRLAEGEATQHTDVAPLPFFSPPVWFRIERSGGVVRLSYSLEFSGVTEWTPIGEEPFPMGEALIGLAVTSHADGSLARGTFDRVTLEGAAPAPPPIAWANALVGPVGVPGSSQFDGTTHTLSASGIDIWDTSDSFRYTYQTLPGNGSIVARVASLAGPNEWTKAGVMIRASLSPGSAHGFVLLSRDFGLAFQRRTTEGGMSTHTSGSAGTAPQWVCLTRNGQVVTASTSVDGVTWTDFGSDTLAIGTGPVLVGLAVTSHDDGAVATATFDSVSVVK